APRPAALPPGWAPLSPGRAVPHARRRARDPGARRPLARARASGGGRLCGRSDRRLGERRQCGARDRARVPGAARARAWGARRDRRHRLRGTLAPAGTPPGRPPAAALAVTVNGEALLPVPLELPPGVSAVRLPYRFANAGAYLLEAKLLLAPGAPPAPGAVAAAITVTGPLRVLVVSERARPLVALALAKRGMDVEVTAPPGLAARTPRLADYHLVVLEDVARAG